MLTLFVFRTLEHCNELLQRYIYLSLDPDYTYFQWSFPGYGPYMAETRSAVSQFRAVQREVTLTRILENINLFVLYSS